MTGQTVHVVREDGPRVTDGQSSDGSRANGAARIVREPQADSLARTRTVRYPYTDDSTNLLQQNFDTSRDLRASSQELDEHAKNLHLKDSPRAMGRQSASPRLEQPEVKTEKSTSPIPPWISQTA
jgi:hypothetical protein